MINIRTVNAQGSSSDHAKKIVADLFDVIHADFCSGSLYSDEKIFKNKTENTHDNLRMNLQRKS